ncbi:22602_t:CDS:2 [Racocetra persica]|uniref:22602_t:CDS:1 n=1 Tax=Racocetra persica TaxID=160502 RepID=A0ACA9KS02_9GLOM|nr:22602_t:CDS:2 [Racocetra persica]
MKVKEKWVGVYTSRIMHLSATTTQYDKSAHSAIKYAIETSEIVPKVKLSEIKIPEQIRKKGHSSGTKQLPIALENMEAKRKKNKVDVALAIAIQGNEENWNLVKLAINNIRVSGITMFIFTLVFVTRLLQLAADTFSIPIAIFYEKDKQYAMFSC